MNTKQAEHESALDRLRADMARRENRLMLAIFGAAGLATTILGVIISIAV